MDDSALTAAFEAHKAGGTKFTRRMAINIADHFGTTPQAVVHRLEQLRLLKKGGWRWFVRNGGITTAHIREVRADRLALSQGVTS